MPSTARNSARSLRIFPICVQRSPTTLSLKGFSGAAARTLSILRLVRNPITDKSSSTYPAYISCPLKCSPIHAPATVPTIIARKVPSSITPFPQERLFSGSNSGNRPYFEGPNNAAWLATSVSAVSESPKEWVARPAVASSMEPNSIAFVQIVICRLLNRSASQPPGMLKTRNGTENRNVTIETNVSRSARAKFIPTIIESNRLRRMLSLNAPWNCVAMRAQKP